MGAETDLQVASAQNEEQERLVAEFVVSDNPTDAARRYPNDSFLG